MELHGRPIPVAGTLGMELVSVEPGRATVRFAFRPEYTNPFGQLQGGVYAVLMDAAMSVAAGGIATTSMQFSIFRPVSAGTLIISAQVVKDGRTVLFAEAEVRDEHGRLVARGNQTGLRRDRDGRTPS